MSPAPPVRPVGRGAKLASLLRRRWWVAAAAAVVVVVLVIVALALRPHGRYLPPPNARQYRDFTACLLTGAGGVAEPGAGVAWAGMQDASATTLIQVSYLAAAGPDTVENVAPYAASLVQRRCDVIVAVGPTEVRAAGQQAAAHPQIRFVLVAGEPGGVGGPNVSTVRADEPSGVRPAVAGIIERAVRR